MFSNSLIREKTAWISLGTLRYTPGLKQVAESRFEDNLMFYSGEFFEDTDNGTNKVTLIGPASTADVTLTLPSATGIVATTDDATALAIALG